MNLPCKVMVNQHQLDWFKLCGFSVRVPIVGLKQLISAHGCWDHDHDTSSWHALRHISHSNIIYLDIYHGPIKTHLFQGLCDRISHLGFPTQEHVHCFPSRHAHIRERTQTKIWNLLWTFKIISDPLTIDGFIEPFLRVLIKSKKISLSHSLIESYLLF